MTLFRKIVLTALACLAIPVGLPAAGLTVLRRDSRELKELPFVSGEGSNYLDLGEAAGLLGGSLAWERPAERLVWSLEGRSFAFEDRLAFFSVDGQAYQLVAPCRLEGGKFLVPAQLAVEYLPAFLPQRFVYNKLDGRLLDKAGPGGAGAQVEPEPRKKEPPAAVPGKAGDGDNYRIRTVVIDPGHGGKDPGALSHRFKLQEKQVVLDLAQKVARSLEKDGGLKVILTRDEDVFVPLRQRGQIANEKGARLFVSLHCNSHRSSGVNGTSTYFLDAAKTDEERATAMLENGALKYELEDANQERQADINLILQDMAQNEYLRESKDLSAYIQQELVKVTEIQDRGLRQANFAVLRGAYMPAALVETAYISNANDEKLLRSPRFRENLADSIARGILNYIEHYHKKLASGK